MACGKRTRGASFPKADVRFTRIEAIDALCSITKSGPLALCLIFEGNDVRTAISECYGAFFSNGCDCFLKRGLIIFEQIVPDNGCSVCCYNFQRPAVSTFKFLYVHLKGDVFLNDVPRSARNDQVWFTFHKEALWI